MLSAMEAPGSWRRAGMDGAVCGLDIPQMLARLDEDIDPGAARRLALLAEGPALAAIVEKQRGQAEGER